MRYKSLPIWCALEPRSVVVVDVQPQYTRDYELITGINALAAECKASPDCREVLVLYNGKEHFNEPGFPSENELRLFYEEYDAPVLADNPNYYDKGYGFFRSCIDVGFATNAIIPVVRWMFENEVWYSTDIPWEDLEEWASRELPPEWDTELVRFLRDHEDEISIPQLMTELQYLPAPIALVGGHTEACLREVEIALGALGKEYCTIRRLTY